MYPPIVLLLIKPSTHKTNSITEIVHNIYYSLDLGFSLKPMLHVVSLRTAMLMFIRHDSKIDLIGIWRHGVYPYLCCPQG